MTLELAGEVALIVEADPCRDQCDRFTAQRALAVVILPTAAVWAAGGAALNRIVDDGRAQRVVNGALALVMAVSVACIWI